jgi:hypothetical protein
LVEKSLKSTALATITRQQGQSVGEAFVNGEFFARLHYQRESDIRRRLQGNLASTPYLDHLARLAVG